MSCSRILRLCVVANGCTEVVVVGGDVVVAKTVVVLDTDVVLVATDVVVGKIEL